MAVLNVNGKALNHSADPRTPLLWVLRENLGLKRPLAGAWKTQPQAAAE